MTLSTAALDPRGERLVTVFGNRVACHRAGVLDLQACLECPHLLRLEVAGEPASGTVVCAGPYTEPDTDYAW
jgi:hypothetical protein